jgi:hypothetical protein
VEGKRLNGVVVGGFAANYNAKRNYPPFSKGRVGRGMRG